MISAYDVFAIEKRRCPTLSGPWTCFKTEPHFAEEGKTLAETEDRYQWKDSTTRLVCSYYDWAAHQWKQGTWSKTVRNAARKGVAESLMEGRLQRGADKWRTELFNHRPELWEGEQTEPVGSPEKWETVASGQWMQRAAWNRMVTRPMREQPYTTSDPGNYCVDSRSDFLTREGQGRQAMGDWLHDKSIPWKARRRLLQTNSGTFPCEYTSPATPASRNGVSTRMGYVACVSDAERWAWDF